MGKVTLRQHEPVIAPHGWNSEEQSFVNKLERLFDDIYQRLGVSTSVDLSGYVQAEAGKGLSTNDFTDVDKASLDRVAAIDHSVYVEKEDGKGLSSNDYTTDEKEKLAGLENADLSGYVQKESGKGLSSNDFTDTDKSNLAALVSASAAKSAVVKYGSNSSVSQTIAATTTTTILSISSLPTGYIWIIFGYLSGKPSSSESNDITLTLINGDATLSKAQTYNTSTRTRSLNVSAFIDLRNASESASITMDAYARSKFICSGWDLIAVGFPK